MARIDQIRKDRLEKLARVKKAGLNPYPAKTKRTHKISEALLSFDKLAKAEKEIVLVGRIQLTRSHGGSCFLHFQDGTGRMQAYLKRDVLGKEKYKFFGENLDIGDFIELTGTLFQTKTGEKSILASDFELLAKSIQPLPEKWHGLKDIEERYRKKYLDILMNPAVRAVFEKRTRVIRLLREYLDKQGFLEVETPVLQPIYGGASARPFTTHHNALDIELYLRISDELYLKRLIVAGFEKVYEINKDFRNEGIDKQHNPEFTMLEFYWAYADYNDLMDFTEKMLCYIIKQVCGGLKIEFQKHKLDFTPPWERITYRDLILKYTAIDIDEVKTEKDLKKSIRDRKLKLDISGTIGYGPILDALYKEYCRPKIIQPCFLIDHPAGLMPLAKRKESDLSKIESIQLLCVGYELLKAYSELNDPADQKERWLEQERLAKRGLKEHEVLDEDYIQALEYGMPPTAGWGMGIDRFVSLLTNQHSIKDVILFPLMRPKDK